MRLPPINPYQARIRQYTPGVRPYSPMIDHNIPVIKIPEYDSWRGLQTPSIPQYDAGPFHYQAMNAPPVILYKEDPTQAYPKESPHFDTHSASASEARQKVVRFDTWSHSLGTAIVSHLKRFVRAISNFNWFVRLKIKTFSIFPPLEFASRYLGNANSKEIHDLSRIKKACQISRMLEKNKVRFASIEEVESAIEEQGYNGCKWCMPEWDTG